MIDIKLEYDKYKHLVKDGDILLFKCGKFPCVGWWISKYTNSPYSHAAIAYWENGELYCLEFREFRGSRQYLLGDYVENGDNIDVFRAMSTFRHPILKHSHNKGYYISNNTHTFDEKTADRIVKTAKKLIGIEYDWWTIFKMAKTYIPLLRFKHNHKTDDDWHDSHSFVCSTLITYCYRKHYVDPVPFLADRYTSPGDLARSGIFWKLFTFYRQK